MGEYMTKVIDLQKRKTRVSVMKSGVIRMQDVTSEKKREIENKVHEIIKNINFDASPTVDIVSLVKSQDFVVQTSEMDIETTGCLIVNELETVMDTGKHRLIVVNKFFDNKNNDKNYILKKSRFITAHEYGHFILHKQKNVPLYAHRDTHHRTEQKELEADYFARSILMPFENFVQYIDKITEMNIIESDDEFIALLSTIFKVTKDKVNKRLKDVEELRGAL